MLNDEWTLNDALGYTSIVNELVKNIEEINPPFTLGIYGGWGSGKTSLMKQTYYRVGGKTKSYFFPFGDNIEKEDINDENEKFLKKLRKSDILDYEAIWFNPWKHEIEANPLLGLLHEIREHFNLYTKTNQEAKKLFTVTTRAGLDILTNTIKELTKIDLNPSNIEKYGEKYEKDNFEARSNTQNFRIVFESSIKKLLGSNDKKLIIFIDDLDRCTDNKIIKLLEGIKLYLSTSNCIFIFGMDQNNVLRALEKNGIHEDYLDKLFQSVIRIPTSNNYENFVLEKIVKQHFSNDLNTRTKRVEYSKLLVSILEKNPRKIKNFMNSMKFHWDMRDKSKNLSIEIFTLFHYLRTNYEDIFEMIERDESLFNSIMNVCSYESPNNSSEVYFTKRLKNLIPILSLPQDESSSPNNLLTSELGEEDIISIKNLKFKFKALENFKYEFRHRCKEIQNLDDYIGVIK